MTAAPCPMALPARPARPAGWAWATVRRQPRHWCVPAGLVLAGLAAGAAHAQTPAAAGADAAVARGQQVYEARCSGCHSVDAHRTGPLHRGVLGRRAGTAPGYSFSPALAASGLVWTPDNLLRWLADPDELVPGQKMGARLRVAADRADVVAYLASLGP